MKRKNFWRGMGIGALLAFLLGCSTPQPKATYREVQMANTQANITNCVATGGTVLRDPQPPRPSSDPGPTVLCVYVG